MCPPLCKQFFCEGDSPAVLVSSLDEVIARCCLDLQCMYFQLAHQRYLWQAKYLQTQDIARDASDCQHAAESRSWRPDLRSPLIAQLAT